MAASTDNALPAIGFLSVLSGSDAGLLGGLLVLNAAGRPLEFHCTAPVKANRAQQILYGPALEPYLYGEQIGQALYKKCKANVEIMFTDSTPVLALRDYTNLPVAVVLSDDSASGRADTKSLRVDAAHDAQPKAPHVAKLARFELAGHRLATHQSYDADQAKLRAIWSPHADDFDLFEPFERIRDAIEEAARR